MKDGLFSTVFSLLIAFSFPPLLRAANEVGFIERYALAADREQALGELVPGTEDYYYYYALHYENSGQKEKLAAILEQWKKRFPGSEKRQVIENREALLAYPTDPKRTLEHLKDRLDLRFNDQQEARDKKPDLPSKLDPARIDRAVFLKEALRNADSLNGLSEAELERLVRDKTQLKPGQRRALLKRLDRPDVPGLVDLIATDLRTKESRGFGEFEIHKALLPDQLDELAARVPEIKESHAYVEARLRKLAPGGDADAEFDPSEREAWLDRLWSYAQTLSPVFNTLKAQILLMRLEADRAKGLYDKDRFVEYLKLPRAFPYVNPRQLEQLPDGRFRVNAGSGDFGGVIGSRGIGNDEPLVRDYFLHFFVTEDSWEPYGEFVREKWLKAVFAEAKIVNGTGDAERWASLISPSEFQTLKQRVDIEFAPDNARFFAPKDEVKLRLFVKNTPKLIVKIYEINTLSFFLQQKRPLNTDLALDGLVANVERTQSFSDGPFRRVAADFDFPDLKDRRGAWVIEFIGGGKSSRALIRKGQWQVMQQPGAAGDLLTVLDETNAPVRNAVIWLDGRKFTADEKTGRVLLPFAEKPGRKPLVLADADGSFASFADFEQHAEQYALEAEFHIEREQLLARREATLVVRPTLWAGNPAAGARAPLSLLKETKLTITSVTLDGVSTTQEIKAPKLESGNIFTHQLTVPDRLASLSVSLSGKVDQLSKGGAKLDLETSQSWAFNGIDKTAETNDGHLSKFGDDYVFELLGRNGEPLADQAVEFQFWHRDFYGHVVTLSLRTDEKGRVMLGKLAELSRVAGKLIERPVGSWHLVDSKRTWPGIIHSAAGETIRVPWNDGVKPGTFSLLALRGGVYAGDFSKQVTQNGAFLEIKNLKPGDYSLRLRDDRDLTISILINDGKLVENWLVGSKRRLEVSNPSPLQIESVSATEDGVRIQLRHWNSFARVHVAATRFLPEPGLFAELGKIPVGSLECWNLGKDPNLYAAGREIGDEYRYILERRYAAKYPGNMLTRPGLLLNPWEKRSTEEGEAAACALAGAATGMGGSTRAHKEQGGEASAACMPPGDFSGVGADLDFLAKPAPVLYNLVPDKDGVVTVPRKALGDRQQIQVLAEDLDVAVWRTFTLDEQPTQFADRRLIRNLDPAKAFTEKKEITVMTPGQTLTLADTLTGELETYDSLPGVYALYTTLSHDVNLAKFAWLMQWPSLKEDEKRAKYSEFACHELNFFLSRKDPGFFAKVIQPYLNNKLAKRFMDDYLTGAELRGYLHPKAYWRLNAAEQALVGQRIASETANAARHLQESWELLLPNPDQEDRLFEVALHGRDMAVESEQTLHAPLPGANAFTGATNFSNGAMTINLSNGQTPVTAGLRSGGDAILPRAMAALPPGAAPMLPAEAKKSLGVARQLLNGAASDKSALDFKSAASDALEKNEVSELDASAVEAQRQQAATQAYYRKLGVTKEWAENNYYNLPLDQQTEDLISVNAFWRDYAQWIAAGAKPPFLSEHLAEASRNFSEMMLALAVLDLPFESPKHTTKTEGNVFTMTAGGPLVACHKEIKPAAAVSEGREPELLVSQNFFRQDDRYREEGNEKFDKYVTDEFLSGVVYGANIVVTNPGSATRKVNLLLQIPQGALPVLGSKTTDSRRARLEPYSTQRFEYFFYFPAPAAKGQEFAHYPATVAKDESVAGAAKPFQFKVVRHLSGEDTASWDYVSQYGSESQVFDYLDQHNLERTDLGRVAWRCRQDAAFFRKLTAFGAQRHLYSDDIWRYGVYHNDADAIREWLPRHTHELPCGEWFDSPLLTIDPVKGGEAHEHLEYSPLVNPRAHRIGAEWRITNPVISSQYGELMEILAHKPALDATDNVSVVYYLFLQDRAEEALARLHSIKAEELPERLQIDYLRCYAAFYEQNLKEARAIVQRYADYPVDRWQKLFAEVAAQLDEIENTKEATAAKGNPDQPDREKQQGELAATEPSFEFKIENRTLDLHWKNLPEVTVNYYLIDPEFSFSSNPFVEDDASRSSIIKANKTVRLTLPADREAMQCPLPDEFAKSSVLVEVLGAGLRKTQAYHANTLKLTLSERYGRLDVRDTTDNKPVAAAYVKVYARLRNGTVRFFKDGYTDLRGRFDYTSLNGDESAVAQVQEVRESMPRRSDGLNIQMLKPGELDEVERLSLLVVTDAHGDEVREVTPP